MINTINEYNWQEVKINNIETNPLSHHECKVLFSEDTYRIYRIYPQYKAAENCYGGMQIIGESPENVELWILTEQIVVHSNGNEKPGKEIIVRAFTSLGEAKFRAKVQVETIQNLIRNYFPKNS